MYNDAIAPFQNARLYCEKLHCRKLRMDVSRLETVSNQFSVSVYLNSSCSNLRVTNQTIAVEKGMR